MLLAQAGIVPDAIFDPGIDETIRKGEAPRLHAVRLAKEKVRAAAKAQAAPAFILAADTVVACGRRILPKARDADEVRACLELLSGRRHQVITAVALLTPGGGLRLKSGLTRVRFRRLGAEEIETYVKSGEGVGKAGGYAIQGRAESFVTDIAGSWSNVVGLPLALTITMLGGNGWRLWHG